MITTLIYIPHSQVVCTWSQLVRPSRQRSALAAREQHVILSLPFPVLTLRSCPTMISPQNETVTILPAVLNDEKKFHGS